jgi:hypothetical protein
LPAVSVARTEKTWTPSTGFATLNEVDVVHAPYGDPSRLHRNVAGSFAVNVNVTAPATSERFAGPDVIVVTGGCMSFGGRPLPASAVPGASRQTASSAASSTPRGRSSPRVPFPQSALDRASWLPLEVIAIPLPLRAVRRGGRRTKPAPNLRRSGEALIPLKG